MKLFEVEKKVFCILETPDVQSDNGQRLPAIDLLIIPDRLREQLQVSHLRERIFESCRHGERSVIYV